MNMNDSTWLMIGFGALCLLPLLIAAVVAVLVFVFGRRFVSTFFNPDISTLNQAYERARAANPQAAPEQLIGRIIRRQAFRSGVVGAVTGLGGLVTLPVALPVDIVLSLRLQAALVEFIANRYGHTNPGETESRIRAYLIMSGSGRVSEAAINIITKYLLRVVGKSVSKLVPVLGAVVSFGVNYAIVQAIGGVAVRYYRSQPKLAAGTLAAKPPPRLEGAG